MIEPNQFPSKAELLAAAERIQKKIHHTPVLTSQTLDKKFISHLYFKCENFQKIGAFKYRGASNALLKLGKKNLAQGVITHSSGNHAQALALAAKELNIPAYIIMPNNAPQVKIQAVQDYGAEVFFCEPTQDAREAKTQAVQSEKGSVFIHPFDNPDIIAGQSTCTQEFLKTHVLDLLVVPVGGGGLISGAALAAKYFHPQTLVIGAEPQGADDAARSLKLGSLQPMPAPQTICDGLLTSLGQWTFPIIHHHVREIFTVSEAAIMEAMRLIWERMKIVVEPSAAVTLGAVLENQSYFCNRRVGLILSGGNVDLTQIPW